ncbi:MAG: T9SS C-terminal target domain-containing protein [Vicinamibacterales bacterium]
MNRVATKTILALLLAVGAAFLQGQPVWTQGAGVILDPVNVPGLDKPVRVIRGQFSSDVTLTNQYHYVLRGAVFFQRGATLTVQPGTRVVGEFATLGTLIIDKGARIMAIGTPDQPIVFTSDQPIGQRNRGDWGGMIINGEATINVPGGVAFGEGDTGQYGGTNDDDDSGVLQYVRVEYGGIEFSPDNELNGIAFQAVGRGTTVNYVQVVMNRDDCMEFFGGTVDVKHVILTACGDDSLDWTFGWRGRVQFAVIHQRADDADNGFEADNNGTSNDLLPRSAPTVYNATLIGDPDDNEGRESDDGMLIREGTAGTFRNFIVMGFKEYGINVDQSATQVQLASGALTFANGIIFNNGLISGRTNLDSAAAPIAGMPNILVGGSNDPGLVNPYDHYNPDYRPSSTASLAMTLTPATPPNDGFFEIAPYIGAFMPGDAGNWMAGGWTDFNYDRP